MEIRKKEGTSSRIANFGNDCVVYLVFLDINFIKQLYYNNVVCGVLLDVIWGMFYVCLCSA